MIATLSSSTRGVGEPWSVRIEIRAGLVVPTLGPLEAKAAPDLARALAAGSDEAPAKEPWPGLLGWIRRGLCGAPDPSSRDLAVLRANFRAMTPKAYHRVARTMTEGELVAFVVRWSAAQVRWAARVGARANAELDDQVGPVEQDLRVAKPAAMPTDADAAKVRPGRTLRMPGGAEVVVPAAPSAPGRGRGFVPEIFEAMNGAVQGGKKLNELNGLSGEKA